MLDVANGQYYEPRSEWLVTLRLPGMQGLPPRNPEPSRCAWNSSRTSQQYARHTQASITKTTHQHPCQVETHVKSDTYRWLGRRAFQPQDLLHSTLPHAARGTLLLCATLFRNRLPEASEVPYLTIEFIIDPVQRPEVFCLSLQKSLVFQFDRTNAEKPVRT